MTDHYILRKVKEIEFDCVADEGRISFLASDGTVCDFLFHNIYELRQLFFLFSEAELKALSQLKTANHNF